MPLALLVGSTSKRTCKRLIIIPSALVPVACAINFQPTTDTCLLQTGQPSVHPSKHLTTNITFKRELSIYKQSKPQDPDYRDNSQPGHALARTNRRAKLFLLLIDPSSMELVCRKAACLSSPLALFRHTIHLPIARRIMPPTHRSIFHLNSCHHFLTPTAAPADAIAL